MLHSTTLPVMQCGTQLHQSTVIHLCTALSTSDTYSPQRHLNNRQVIFVTQGQSGIKRGRDQYRGEAKKGVKDIV